MYQTQPNPHYNVIYDYIKYARIVCIAKKQYEYCELHQEWYYRNLGKQCVKCVTNQKFCCMCQTYHEANFKEGEAQFLGFPC
jgi:hypothetical protein